MNTDQSIIDASLELKELIISRRTIHKFKETPPPRELLYEAIDTARWAPNHKLTEPWRFYILGPETAARVAHLNADLLLKTKGPVAAENKRARWLSMPSMIVVSFKKAGDPFREREDYAATCCAIQNMMLFLWSKRLGTKWSTSPVICDVEFYNILGADPEHEEVIGLLWCGYPEDIPLQQRRPVSDITRELP